MHPSRERGGLPQCGHDRRGGAAAVGDRIDEIAWAARHIASKTDVLQSYAVGKAAVEYAVLGMNGVMPAIKRIKTKPYEWKIIPAPLSDVANQEKKMPRDFITTDGFHITQKCRNYLQPLIEGEAYPPYAGGLPRYVTLKNVAVKKKLKAFSL